jgi:hypothetical protein
MMTLLRVGDEKDEVTVERLTKLWVLIAAGKVPREMNG